MITNENKLLFVLSVGNIFTPKASFHNARCEILWKRLKRKGNARRRRGSEKQNLTGDIKRFFTKLTNSSLPGLH